MTCAEMRVNNNRTATFSVFRYSLDLIMSHAAFRLALFVALFFAIATVQAEDDASRLFSDYRQLVYQIRVIDTGSGDKSSIGSGFQVGSDGQLATNFHVVASYIHEPEKYRLEYIAHDGSSGALSLAGFDVIHDLAIVTRDQAGGEHFKLDTRDLDQGERIYSMGNPQDLGMTIIEGTYNGLVKTSRYRKILFSGSLNPGMSGGPAVNADGQIIGINVSKGGEQLSFLVPSAHLKTLLDTVSKDIQAGEYKTQIREALLAEQQAFYGSLLQKEWDQDLLVGVMLPSQLDQSLKCWGHTVDKEDILFESMHQHCKSQDAIYLDRNLYTGKFSYVYEWLSTDALNPVQFYSYLETRFTHSSLQNSFSDEDSTNYACHTDFIDIDGRPWRVSSCARAYREYTGLYDALFLMASVSENDRAVVIRIGAAGISKENADGLLKRFTGSIKWTN